MYQEAFPVQMHTQGNGDEESNLMGKIGRERNLD